MSVISLNPQFVVDKKGRKKSVLLSLAQYKQLLQRLEDLEDALALDEAVREAKGFRDYSEIRAELEKAGRL